MKEKTFNKLLIIVLAVGILSSAALAIWTVYLHDHVSILAYIASEGRW